MALRTRTTLLITLGLGGAIILGSAWLVRSQAAAVPSEASSPAPQATTSTAPPRADIRWIAAAAGQTPDLNQVSLEQDLALAAKTLHGPGTVLLGAGPGAAVIQVLTTPRRAPDDPATLLAELFAPRGGRDSTYRAPSIDVDGPATAASVSAAIETAVSGAQEPLLLYLGGHGHRGPTDAENAVGLWSSQLDAIDLAALLEDTPRQVQLVATTCFSGGLAELAFADANPTAGPFPGDICGLFATTHDLEASGCDPNPDRAAQEGFGLHFLRALAGQRRDGTPLEADAIDFDGDGTIGLREAHAFVRIHSAAFDVPTSTSERWLEAFAPRDGDIAPVSLPEEDAVIDALARQLELAQHPDQANTWLADFEMRIEALNETLSEAQLAEDDAYRHAAADVLARWPVLDDPWHPEFGPMLARNIDAVREHFASSASYATYRSTRDEVDAVSAQIFDLRAKAAPYERLVRAVQYRRRAALLAAEGGPAWERFSALRRCELATPQR